jgi:predicted DNA binding CopG/RHH family protein
MNDDQNITLDEARRLNAWLTQELERQRVLNGEMRRAVAEMARTFQETLARANQAAEQGDIDLVKRITFENRMAWQEYLRQIVQAATVTKHEA